MRENLRVLKQSKLWTIQGSKLTKMKASSQHKSLFNTMKLYSNTQPTPGWLSLHEGPRPLVRLGEKKPAKVDHLNPGDFDCKI